MSGLPVLLLEDDPAIADTVAFALKREAFEVHHVLLVREALAALRARPMAAAILDVGLPDGSGLDLLQTLRRDKSLGHLPVLMLTARSEELDRVLGLELGADDFLGKPFSPRELVARVRALIRRASRPAAGTPLPTLFELDAEGQRVRYAGRWLSLTRLEYGLLRVLVCAPGRIHSRDALLSAVWGPTTDANDRTVDTHVKTLRAKLRDVRPAADPIVTHRGLGYGLAEPGAD